MRLATLIAVLGLNGCAAPVTLDLVMPADWVRVPIDEDALAVGVEPTPTCDESGYRVEEGVLEVNTTDCGWATFTAVLPLELRRGDEVTGQVFHGPLVATEPAQGRLLLEIGATSVIDETPSIPTTATVYDRTVTLEQDEPAEALLHISNHGGNDWRYVHLRLRSRRAEVRELVAE